MKKYKIKRVVIGLAIGVTMVTLAIFVLVVNHIRDFPILLKNRLIKKRV